jgi:hypothetical protein
MAGACTKNDCTVSSTGICLLLHDPPSTCPNFLDSPQPQVSDSTSNLQSGSEAIESSVLSTDTNPDASTKSISSPVARQFYPGTELGLEDAAEIMRCRYAHLIGVIGQTDAGKTALLTALYLMASQGWLHPDYSFAGSLTLQGFEDRARRVRSWDKGKLPDRFMEHTILGTSRRPSFMHLSLSQAHRRLELLLTDLPGEWSADLINKVETSDRFEFLKRADALVYVIDGPLLAANQTKHIELHKAKLMLARLSTTSLLKTDIPLVLFLSKCDELRMVIPEAAASIEQEAVALGFTPKLIMSACFSRMPESVVSGTGVKEVIDCVLGAVRRPKPTTLEDDPHFNNSDRAFARFRRTAQR